MSVTVRTQAELDAALAAGQPSIVIHSDPDITLHITATDSSRVAARGSSRVVAWGSSSVEAWDSSSVVARGSSHVAAWDSSSVEAWDSSSVEAWGSSRVEAWGSSRVEAWDFSHVVASDSSRVAARGSSSVEAWDSSSVEAWGSSRVAARGTSRVAARGTSRVEAGRFVPVHIHSLGATVTGGVVIDMTAVNEADPQAWCDMHGVEVDAKGNVVLYKALLDDLISGQRWKPVRWKTKGVVKCDDFDRTNQCGGGLHLSPTIWSATAYLPAATRWLKVRAKFSDLQPVTGGAPKVKVPKCTVICEVDAFGVPLSAAEQQRRAS